MVPVVDLSRHGREVADAYLAAVRAVLERGTYLLGEETMAFEAELAGWAQAPNAVAVGSGAAAIQLALAALGVGPGDEVIVPAFTAVPTASAVMALGATPVLVDVEACTATLDPALAAEAITDRTRAIVPVHLYGLAATLPDVAVPIVEDAAQAHGAVTDHHRSAAVAYSFYPTKNLGGIGDGGAVVTRDAELAATLRRLRVHGMTQQYVHEDVSQNFRMSEIEAAWLRLGLVQLDAWTARRRAIAAHYREAAPHLRWHAMSADHVHHLCVLRTTERDAFRAAMAERGVATAVHYPLALTQQPAYHELTTWRCPQAEAWARECVTVPCFPELTDAEVEQVAAALAALPAVHAETAGSR